MCVLHVAFVCLQQNLDSHLLHVPTTSLFIDEVVFIYFIIQIRLLLPNREVKKDDFTFATRNFPGTFRPYATAKDCVSRSCHAQYRKGRFNVDLTGTSFHLPQVIPYEFHSFPECVRKVFAASMSDDQLRWSGKCGGWCGSCWPTALTLLVNGC